MVTAVDMMLKHKLNNAYKKGLKLALDTEVTVVHLFTIIGICLNVGFRHIMTQVYGRIISIVQKGEQINCIDLQGVNR